MIGFDGGSVSLSLLGLGSLNSNTHERRCTAGSACQPLTRSPACYHVTMSLGQPLTRFQVIIRNDDKKKDTAMASADAARSALRTIAVGLERFPNGFMRVPEVPLPRWWRRAKLGAAAPTPRQALPLSCVWSRSPQPVVAFRPIPASERLSQRQLQLSK
eukprot:scaffold2161_cov244-Pinguiococcus_pyrenoidosus.AAC.3